MKKLGHLLQTKRKELNLSIRKASELIGISHTYLSNLEKANDPRSGAPVKPTLETLKLISNAYKIDLNVLMDISGYASFLQTNRLAENTFKETATQHKPTKKEKIAEELIQVLVDAGELKPGEELSEEKRERLFKMIKKAIELSKL
ncbi:helix-turn-helix domain-containing protein [Crassaminicella thermophila]|uniref:helix-turn-helix domain-containing protein n=1 Tax=Crassaminicella thermophila TaxID=2599308 RepID=UPI00143DC6E5|nr:helix-turn-helix transcriptional regulator [Crassaminicella thermophila]